MDMVGEWMEPREKQLEARGVLLNKRAELRMDPGLRTPEALVLSEAIDEVGWFQHMLWVKCQRALQGKIADPEWMKEFDMDPVQSDWNGTAKLCLHIVDRCQQAWATIAELMPEEADDIEPMQEVLRRCKTELDKEFPDAEKFIRPGFDA